MSQPMTCSLPIYFMVITYVYNRKSAQMIVAERVDRVDARVDLRKSILQGVPPIPGVEKTAGRLHGALQRLRVESKPDEDFIATDIQRKNSVAVIGNITDRYFSP